MRTFNMFFEPLNESTGSGCQEEIAIDKQVWAIENLNVDTFRNGDPIFNAITNEDWTNACYKRQPAWCYYDNNATNGPIYGKLYNWYAVNDPRGLAPSGYLIPTDDDWADLYYFLSDRPGVKMKSKKGWKKNSKNHPKSDYNSSGFSALPGGLRFFDGTFHYEGEEGYWWSSTESIESSYFLGLALIRSLHYNIDDLIRSHNFFDVGMSVRCIKE